MPRCWSFYSIISFKKLENKLIMSNYLTFNFKISFWYLQLECTIFCHKVRIFWEGHKIWKNLPLKILVFSKPSGKLVFWARYLFIELDTYFKFFHFAELCQVWGRLDNIYVTHFTRVPPLMFFVFVIYPKFKGGTLVKCVV